MKPDSVATRWLLTLGAALGCAALFAPPAPAQADPKAASAVPSAEAVADLLQREPITLQSWPAWRDRLRSWVNDRSDRTNSAFDAARNFVKQQADSSGELPSALSKDAFAWYLLGSRILYDIPRERANVRQEAEQAERALRRSTQLDPGFARAHRNLGMALLLQEDPLAGSFRPARVGAPQPPPKWNEANRELEEMKRLDPTLSRSSVDGYVAMIQRRFADAEQHYWQAVREDPGDINVARFAAQATIFNQPANPTDRPPPRAPKVKQLLDRFPEDGVLVCLHGVALAADGESRAALREFDRARGMGTDPEQLFPPDLIRQIEEDATPGLLERFAWIMLYFAAFYAVVMGLMTVFGLVLATRTRGSKALQLLGDQPDELVSAGQVVRSGHESLLARLYALGLFGGLILFYAAIPFVIAGLLAATGLLLYLIFMLRRVPVKLIVVIVVVGAGGAWAVFKSLFARPGSGSFGLPKTAEQCPRLYEALTEVACRVDTPPVDEVYVAPGSAIGVHQEGRGPFGIFGVKKRVLTLGLSTMHFLTVNELKAILAHEYAHFSHSDTFYSRFIYQVTLSIEQALNGMGQAGGYFNYVNPFFWFLYLYYKAYALLAAGYSRSREFLADRMASSLYGSDVFAGALTKVCTDGTLFEMVVHDNIAKLLEENKAFVNMYQAFRSFRDEQLSAADRDGLYQKLLDERGSLFASHPTFGERIEAVAALPKAAEKDATPALQLFESPEVLEQELTEFLTGYIHYVRQLQAQAAAAQ